MSAGCWEDLLLHHSRMLLSLLRLGHPLGKRMVHQCTKCGELEDGIPLLETLISSLEEDDGDDSNGPREP